MTKGDRRAAVLKRMSRSGAWSPEREKSSLGVKIHVSERISCCGSENGEGDAEAEVEVE